MKRAVAIYFLLASLALAAGTTQENAQKIMGKNFIGVQDVEKNFGVKYSPEQLKALANIPYSEVTLRETATSHVLVAGYPLTADELTFRLFKSGVRVTDWLNTTFASHREEEIAFKLVSENRIDFTDFTGLFRSWKKTSGDSGANEKSWFDQNIRVETRWYLLRKEIFFPEVPKSWQELEANGKKEEQLFSPTPGAKYEGMKFRELFYVVTLLRLARGEMLFTRTIAHSTEISGTGPRTNSLDGRGAMYVGFEEEGHVYISNTYMYHASFGFKKEPVLGRAALRKFD